MPAAVACPKCQAKYQLPDSLMGKPVKCKACGTTFKINPPKAKAVAPVKRTNPSQGNPQAFANAGLDGPIMETPDLFAETAQTKVDPLANHVVQDPGFAFDPFAKADAENDEALAYADVKSNAAIRNKKAKKRTDDPLAEYLDGDALMGIEKQPEDTDSTLTVMSAALAVMGLGWSIYALLQNLEVVESEVPGFTTMAEVIGGAVVFLAGVLILLRWIPLVAWAFALMAMVGSQGYSAYRYFDGVWNNVVLKGILFMVIGMTFLAVWRYTTEKRELAKARKSGKRRSKQ